jgi:DNA-binding MarR family transcriptional regulator
MGERTIAETARAAVIDLPAMEAVAAVHRASGALRSRAERRVLGPHRLTWTTWVVLQIVSVWQEIETRHVASEAGISKSTLTGVVATLDRRGLIRRRVHPADARRVLLTPTETGSELVSHLLPRINAEETAMLSGIPRESLGPLTQSLRELADTLRPAYASSGPLGPNDSAALPGPPD